MNHGPRHGAVERAYREHAGDVYRVAYAVLRDPDAAADVTQDTFARAFERWEQYDASRPLRAWLLGIATKAALDAVRRRKVRGLGFKHGPRDANGSAGETLAAYAGWGADPLVHIVRRRLVDEALETLKPDARAALVLRHYHGYGYAEIATFLGTSRGNVGSIISRAHAALRTRLNTESPPTTTSAAAAQAGGPLAPR